MSEELKFLLHTMETFNSDLKVENTEVTTLYFKKNETKLLLNYIEQLQQENEYNKYILAEFEKWLEKKKKKLDTSNDFDRYARLIIIECLDKLQELKEGKK